MDAGLPFAGEVDRRLRHPRRHGGDALSVEGRLSEAALPQPEAPFAGEQAVADEAAQEGVRRMLLGVVGDVVLQDAAGTLGMGDEVGIVEAEPVARHVPVPLADPRPAGERVLEVAAQDPQEGDVLAGRFLRREEFGAGRIDAAHAPIYEMETKAVHRRAR